MITTISNNQNNRTFGACLAKNGQKIETFEEIGHLMDIGLQAHTGGLKYGSFFNGVHIFLPSSEQTPKVFLNESKKRITAEMPDGDVLIFYNHKKDSEEQKNLFAKAVASLSAIAVKAKNEEAIRRDKCRLAETMDYFGINRRDVFFVKKPKPELPSEEMLRFRSQIANLFPEGF